MPALNYDRRAQIVCGIMCRAGLCECVQFDLLAVVFRGGIPDFEVPPFCEGCDCQLKDVD